MIWYRDKRFYYLITLILLIVLLFLLSITNIFIIGSTGIVYLVWQKRRDSSFVKKFLSLGRSQLAAVGTIGKTTTRFTNVAREMSPQISNVRLNESFETRSPTPNFNERFKCVQKAAGPLLIHRRERFSLNEGSLHDDHSSTSNVSLGYLGNTRLLLSGRRRYPSHQVEYASLGSFPRVHLMKPNKPLLNMKSTPVTIRIAPPLMLTPNQKMNLLTPARKSPEHVENNPCDPKRIVAAIRDNNKKRSFKEDMSGNEAKRRRQEGSERELVEGRKRAAANTSPAQRVIKRHKNDAIACSLSSTKRHYEMVDVDSSRVSLPKIKHRKIPTSRILEKVVTVEKTVALPTGQSEPPEDILDSLEIEEVSERSLKEGQSHRSLSDLYSGLAKSSRTDYNFPDYLATLEDQKQDQIIEQKRLKHLLRIKSPITPAVCKESKTISSSSFVSPPSTVTTVSMVLPAFVGTVSSSSPFPAMTTNPITTSVFSSPITTSLTTAIASPIPSATESVIPENSVASPVIPTVPAQNNPLLKSFYDNLAASSATTSVAMTFKSSSVEPSVFGKPLAVTTSALSSGSVPSVPSFSFAPAKTNFGDSVSVAESTLETSQPPSYFNSSHLLVPPTTTSGSYFSSTITTNSVLGSNASMPLFGPTETVAGDTKVAGPVNLFGVQKALFPVVSSTQNMFGTQSSTTASAGMFASPVPATSSSNFFSNQASSLTLTPVSQGLTFGVPKETPVGQGLAVQKVAQTNQGLAFGMEKEVQTSQGLTFGMQKEVQTSQGLGFGMQKEAQTTQGLTFGMQKDVQTSQGLTFGMQKDIQTNQGLAFGIPKEAQMNQGLTFGLGKVEPQTLVTSSQPSFGAPSFNFTPSNGAFNATPQFNFGAKPDSLPSFGSSFPTNGTTFGSPSPSAAPVFSTVTSTPNFSFTTEQSKNFSFGPIAQDTSFVAHPAAPPFVFSGGVVPAATNPASQLFSIGSGLKERKTAVPRRRARK